MARKNPQEKKELNYKKERRTGAAHGYVKSYPKVKARINRASRHEANAVLKGAGIGSLDSAVEITDAEAITRERLQHSVEHAPGNDFKAYAYTLKEWVNSRLEYRVQFAGRDKYFAEDYNSDKHRKGFGRYLRTILSGSTAKSAELARFYGEVLNPSKPPDGERHYVRWKAWLQAFFRDEPEYERELISWIREMKRLYPKD
jgi:hypothetical protein